MLSKVIETTTLGFTLKVKAASNTMELLQQVEDEKAVDLANAYVLAHIFLSKARRVIVKTVANYTGLKKLTKVVDDKDVPVEKDDAFVTRATKDLSAEDKKQLATAVQAALDEEGLNSLNYAVASRQAGGSLTKGLATYVKKAWAAWETANARYRAAYVAKNMGPAEDLDEEFDKDETPSHIVNFATHLKKVAEEAARQAEAGAF